MDTETQNNKLIPKKSLGQHFLTSKSALQKIIEAADIKSDEKILEIGPGTGILTEQLLKTGAKIIAVEKDLRSITVLNDKFSDFIARGQLNLVSGDILEINIRDFGLEEGKYAVVANIPYYITGAILEMFLENSPRPNRMVLLVQKEVAERIVARDGKESILSVSVKAFGDPKIVDKVLRGAFNPPPNVDSAILLISNISDQRFADKRLEIRRFFDIVKAGFAHKRKILRGNLEEIIGKDKVDEIWKKIGLDDKIRAENLKLEGWISICTN